MANKLIIQRLGMVRMIGVLLSCLLVSVAALAEPASVDSVVANFFPERLIKLDAESVAQGGVSLPRSQSWVALTGDGKIVAAAYSNGTFGGVRLLKIVDGQGSLLFDSGDADIVGENPSMQAVDLNGDGKLDLIATFVAGRGSDCAWIFLFDGTSLQAVPAPPSQEIFHDPLLIQLDDSGKPALLDGYCDDNNCDEGHSYFYRLSGDHYVQGEEVVYFGMNGRGEGDKPEPQAESFESPVRNAMLLLINGTDGSAKAAAAEVFVNGEEVISRDQLNEQVARVVVPVTLHDPGDLNEISSTVFGKPLAGIVLFVYVPVADQPSAKRDAN